MKLDILVISAHPDDAELGCGGTIVKATKSGRQVGVVDLTKGELSTKGTVEIRQREADQAKEILGLAIRNNMGFRDGFFTNDEMHQMALIQVVREYQPEIVLAAAPMDRHPDHSRASDLIIDACFLSGLSRITTELNGTDQPFWRPNPYIISYNLISFNQILYWMFPSIGKQK